MSEQLVMSQLNVELEAFAKKYATEPLPPEIKDLAMGYKPDNLKVMQELQRQAVLKGADFVKKKLGLSDEDARILRMALRFTRANFSAAQEIFGKVSDNEEQHELEYQQVDDLTERLCVYL